MRKFIIAISILAASVMFLCACEGLVVPIDDTSSGTSVGTSETVIDNESTGGSTADGGDESLTDSTEESVAESTEESAEDSIEESTGESIVESTEESTQESIEESVNDSEEESTSEDPDAGWTPFY